MSKLTCGANSCPFFRRFAEEAADLERRTKIADEKAASLAADWDSVSDKLDEHMRSVADRVTDSDLLFTDAYIPEPSVPLTQELLASISRLRAERNAKLNDRLKAVHDIPLLCGIIGNCALGPAEQTPDED